MTSITKDEKVLTFINVFTTDPIHQNRVVELLHAATSQHDYQAMRNDPGPLLYLQEALKIAKFEPGTYEVVETYGSARALTRE